jgi:glucose-6-phosphate isomerase
MIEIKGLDKLWDQELTVKCAQAWDQLHTRTDIGFQQLPARAQLWKVCQVRTSLIANRVDRVVVVGIGGAILGAKVLWETVGQFVSTRPFHFLESTDPLAFDKLCSEIKDWSRTHFIIVSKSGGTLETIALVENLSARMTEKSLKLGQFSTLIAGEEGAALQEWGKANSVATLPFPTDVGGRFSVLSPSGMFPACLMNINIEDIRVGAIWALEQKRMISSVCSAFIKSFDRGEFITQMWIYSERWKSVGAWWQQLWSESLAKKETRKKIPAKRVSTPMVCVGPQDQHSLLQQLFEGHKDKLVIVVRSKETEKQGKRLGNAEVGKFQRPLTGLTLGNILAAEGQAMESSLLESGISCLSMNILENTPKALGALFMLWELIVGTMGETLDIDTFNQPGVELGKRHAIQNLRQQL